MKIVIDIPEEVKKVFDKAKEDNLKGSYYDYNSLIGKAIQNGTPLPDNVTNGDVIKAICPAWINYHSSDIELIIDYKDWNAPYEGGRE